MITWRVRIACWLTKATHIHSQYVTFIVSSLEQWLQERASVLGYMYLACLSRLFPLHLNPLQPRPSVFHTIFLFSPARDYKCKSQPEYRRFSPGRCCCYILVTDTLTSNLYLLSIRKNPPVPFSARFMSR